MFPIPDNTKSHLPQRITVLEGKAISKPVPDYPWLARVLNVTGEVKVEVVIDESGKVIEAKVKSGPRLLKQVAVDAARKARFTPTLLSDQPIKVAGLITYRFQIDKG